MSEKELFDLLCTVSTTMPVAYDHFEEYPDHKIKPPFIVYRNTDTFTQKAEDVTWQKWNNYIVDLATETKDTSLEATIETLFTNNGIPFDKEENYIDEERIYQIRYFIC